MWQNEVQLDMPYMTMQYDAEKTQIARQITAPVVTHTHLSVTLYVRVQSCYLIYVLGK